MYFCSILKCMKILIIKPRMKLSNTFNRLRWRHWLLLSLLVLVLVIKWSPYLGYIYTLYIYSTIGRILSSFSGIFPFAIGDIFIALSIAWVILYPLYEIVLRKRLARRYAPSWQLKGTVIPRQRRCGEEWQNICCGSTYGSTWPGDSTTRSPTSISAQA